MMPPSMKPTSRCHRDVDDHQEVDKLPRKKTGHRFTWPVPTKNRGNHAGGRAPLTKPSSAYMPASSWSVHAPLMKPTTSARTIASPAQCAAAARSCLSLSLSLSPLWILWVQVKTRVHILDRFPFLYSWNLLSIVDHDGLWALRPPGETWGFWAGQTVSGRRSLGRRKLSGHDVWAHSAGRLKVRRAEQLSTHLRSQINFLAYRPNKAHKASGKFLFNF
jgi:hypothetical protein